LYNASIAAIYCHYNSGGKGRVKENETICAGKL